LTLVKLIQGVNGATIGKKLTSDWEKKLAEHMDAFNRRKLTAKDKKRLEKLKRMLRQLMRGENVQP
jgi:hypothetical protein